jgi:hypothetical protein
MTTYNVSTAADLYGHLVTGGGSYPASYERDDVISIAAGTYTLDGHVTPAAGRLAGVIIQGAGIDQTIINPKKWEIAAGGRVILKDLTIRLDGMGLTSYGYGSMDLADGAWRLERVKITSNGANTGNAITFVADESACVAVMLDCLVIGPQRDCISTKAPGGFALADMSSLTVIRTRAADQGVNTNDQCITSHDGFPIRMFGGSLKSSSASRAAAAQDYSYSELMLCNVGVEQGTVRSIVTGSWWQDGEFISRN